MAVLAWPASRSGRADAAWNTSLLVGASTGSSAPWAARTPGVPRRERVHQIRTISLNKSSRCLDRYRNPSRGTRNSPYTARMNPG
jgi:hypothetical protein